MRVDDAGQDRQPGRIDQFRPRRHAEVSPDRDDDAVARQDVGMEPTARRYDQTAAHQRFGHGRSTLLRNARVRSWLGLEKISLGVLRSTMTPLSMNTTWRATSRAKPISCVTTIMVSPSLASSRMTASTSSI